jgi:PAS domain S-box-containing protein
LCVEDIPTDAMMLNHALRQGGLNFRLKRVETKEVFLRELEENPPDVILSDHGLPSFDGFTALSIARDKCPDVPFIFVTSALGEEKTIETFERGATDYVLKKDLSKLVPSVERALREADERTALKQKDQQLRESEERYRRLIEFCPDAFLLECDGQIVFANMSAARLLGVERPEQLVGKPMKEIVHLDFWEGLEQRLAGIRSSGTTFFWRKVQKENVQKLNEQDAPFPFVESKFVRLDGSPVEVEVSATPLTLQKRQAVQIIVRNLRECKPSGNALQKSEEGFRLLVDRSPEAILIVQADARITFANPAAAKLLGTASAADLVGQSVDKFFRTDPSATIARRVRRLRRGQSSTPFEEQRLYRTDGVPLDVELSAAPVIYEGKGAVQVIAHGIGECKQSLEKLRKSEAAKTLILETALDAIIFVDHDGRIQEWNPAAEKIFGYSHGEAVGRRMDDLIVLPAMRETYHDGLIHYLMTGAGSLIDRLIELALRRKNGSEFRAEIGISRILTEDPPHCTVLIRDITERKQAEVSLQQSEERLRLLVENIKNYAIYMLDPQGNVITWNAGAEEVEGFKTDEILGKHLSTFFPPEDVARGLPHEALRRAESEGNARIEGWRVRKDGSRFWSEGVVTALYDEAGKLRGFSKIAHDITQQKEAAERISQLNDQLEDRVRSRTAQLEAANKELEAFSYSISHDLRAPLRHISGYVEILQTEATNLDTSCRQHLQTVADSAKSLGDLIDALLAFSRMGRAEISQQHVNLDALVKEVRQTLSRDLEGRDIVWRIGHLPEAQGDPLMLRQVIINLVSNALKYTRQRARATIEIGAMDSENETVFFIRDDGVGFNMQYADKLFGVFQRLHPANEFEGIGIGLANVRRIIHRHGGRTWAEGKVNSGATFYFSLPKKATKEAS